MLEDAAESSIGGVNAKEFSDRLWDYAHAVADLVETIPNTIVGRHVASQLIRACTSPAANYEEACDAESRKDFAHKLGIAIKEVRESHGWIRFLDRRKMVRKNDVGPLLNEALQLRRLLGRSLITLRTRKDLP